MRGVGHPRGSLDGILLVVTDEFFDQAIEVGVIVFHSCRTRHESSCAIADVALDFLYGQRGTTVHLEGMIAGQCEVGTGIEECAVQVENNDAGWGM